MIKKLFSAALIACTIGTQAQQVLNPGFENWTGANPDNWGSFDQMLVGLGQPNPGGTTQTTTKNSGTYAVLLTSQTVAIAGGVVTGIVSTGPITLVGSSPAIGRQAYAGQPTSYTFYYQYAPMGVDTGFSQVILTKWNTGLGRRDTLATGGVLIHGTVSAYTQQSVTINWRVALTNSDSIQLIFASTKHSTSTAVAGTKLYVDDVNMVMNSTNVQTLMADGSFNAYPNPAVNTITITSTDENAKYAKVYDLTGRMINTYELSNKSAKVDLSAYENGMYIYVITDVNNTQLHTAKFNVAK
ncbi:MAG TPA: T9SS type A sorting domain-containing protein [Bacteroidia bacterium]|jgi:hypothetical protein|nr:T9SS type A sorting domain-containing protein [Bacteroidia bacterium]